MSPVVARIAAEHGIDPSVVPGTGTGGRVTKKDILGFIESGAQAQPAAEQAAAPPAPPPAPAQAAPAQAPPPAPAPVYRETVVYRPAARTTTTTRVDNGDGSVTYTSTYNPSTYRPVYQSNYDRR